jgi:hypothetical protein
MQTVPTTPAKNATRCHCDSLFLIQNFLAPKTPPASIVMMSTFMGSVTGRFCRSKVTMTNTPAKRLTEIPSIDTSRERRTSLLSKGLIIYDAESFGDSMGMSTEAPGCTRSLGNGTAQDCIRMAMLFYFVNWNNEQ